MPSSKHNPLLLLRHLRDVMAQQASAQNKLDQIVELLSAGLHADVCSLYLLRAGDILELYASHGLRHEALHHARLSVGEGLVGDIAAHARPLNLADAREHPNFVYIEATGEEAYHSFAGVPMLRNGQVIGVIVVQHRRREEFSDEAMEVMQTVAMVLAEMVGTKELAVSDELARGSGQSMVSRHFAGAALAPGVAKAEAVIHRQIADIHTVIAEDPAKEEERLEKAIHSFQREMDKLIAESQQQAVEARDIIEAFRMIAYDEGWVKRIREAIHTGLTAEAAVRRVQNEITGRMAESSSKYLRERLRDIEEMSNRLILHLSTGGEAPAPVKLPDAFILVARSVGVAELLEYPPGVVKGVVLEEGPSTAHIVIIAKAMGIPVVGNIVQATRLFRAGEKVVVDGDHGEVYLRPSDDVEQAVADYLTERESRLRKLLAHPEEESITLDGTRIRLFVNAGMFMDLAEMKRVGAEGVGLYRTEIPYMMAQRFPSVEEQADTYTRVLDQAEGRRVVFRTFDVGADKQLSYLHIPEEINPALGWRATRIALDRPSILLRQCRALLLASRGRELRIMFPFISDMSEFRRARALLMREHALLKKQGKPLPEKLMIGTMLEIPSLMWQLPELLKETDFISVGSNDLLQYLYAADRGNAAISGRYDVLAAASMRLFQQLADACAQANVPLCFCGELAGSPVGALALIAVGVRELSMGPGSVLDVKAAIRQVDMTTLKQFVLPMIERGQALTPRLQAFARDHGISW